MRRTIVCVLAVALVAALTAPASANKHRRVHVHDSFSAEALPFPKLAAWGDVLGIEEPGCLAGQEGVHWVAVEFKAPGRGKLTATLEGFMGDWDLYLLDENADRTQPLVRGEGDQATAGEEAKEEVSLGLRRNQVVHIAACNWLGEPGPLEVHYEGVFRR